MVFVSGRQPGTPATAQPAQQANSPAQPVQPERRRLRHQPERQRDQTQLHSHQGRAHTHLALLDESASAASPASQTRRKGIFGRWAPTVGSGIGGAVMGFFLGGKPGAIIGAATGAGLGFLLPQIFEKVKSFLHNCLEGCKKHLHLGADDHDHHDQRQTIERGGRHLQRGGGIPETSYLPRGYIDINSLPGGENVGGQTHYPPTKSGNGDGKTTYFFIGFKNNTHDQNMRRRVEPYLADDIQRLRDHGYKVVVDTFGTQAAFQRAVDDDSNAGIYWAGHGMPNGIQDSQSGRIFSPESITPNPNSQMRYCIFKTCLAGQREKAWEQTLGTDVIAHNRVIYDSEIRDFNDPEDSKHNELDDLISERLINQPWETAPAPQPSAPGTQGE